MITYYHKLDAEYPHRLVLHGLSVTVSAFNLMKQCLADCNFKGEADWWPTNGDTLDICIGFTDYTDTVLFKLAYTGHTL